MPELGEVKDRVREEVVKQKARELSKQKAAELAAKLKSAPDFDKAAKAAGVEAEDHRAHRPQLADSRSRRRARPSKRRRSSCRSARVSDPIATDNGTAIVKVLEKQEVTPSELAERQGQVPRGAALRSPQPLLQRLHGEGEAEDEDRSQPRGAAARRQLGIRVEARDRLEADSLVTYPAPPSRAATRDLRAQSRRNVNGISASGSPRWNIASGPRSVRIASSSPRVRFADIHAPTAIWSPDAGQLLGEQLVEALPRRIDDQLHFAVGGNLGALLGDGDGAIEAAELVDQAVVLRLLSGPHPPLRERVDLLGLGVPRLGRLLDELIVERLQLLLDLLQLLGVVGPRRRVRSRRGGRCSSTRCGRRAFRRRRR